MITIKEIARKAGVSPTTVSNVLNGNAGKMSTVTREKVEVILREENYTPNMGAHILARRNSRTMGVIMFTEPRRNETVIEDPFASSILGAIEAELRHNDYYMMLHSTCDKEEVLRLCSSWMLAGLILLWVPDHLIGEMKERIKIPVVFVDSPIPDDVPGCLSVGLEDRRGGYEIARYLVSRGHREILFLSNDELHPGTDYNRYLGCRDAVEKAGGSWDDSRFKALSKRRDERLRLYEEVGHPSSPYTALVFSADYYAVEAISHFHDLGIRVPQDISVTGFDDNIYSRIVRPRLTTVHQDTSVKGQIAVDLLVQNIKGGASEERHLYLPVHLEIRESVGTVK